MDDSPHTAPRGVSGDFFSKFKFKPQMPKQTTATILKPYKHPHCDRRERYKCEVLTKAPHCRECNRILLERTRAPTATTDNSTEVAALRQEVAELKSLVLRLQGLVENGVVPWSHQRRWTKPLSYGDGGDAHRRAQHGQRGRVRP